MNQALNWISHHQAVAGAAAIWLFSSVVSSMPPPRVSSGIAYQWLYKMLQTLGGSLKQINLVKGEMAEISKPTIPPSA